MFHTLGSKSPITPNPSGRGEPSGLGVSGLGGMIFDSPYLIAEEYDVVCLNCKLSIHESPSCLSLYESTSYVSVLTSVSKCYLRQVELKDHTGVAKFVGSIPVFGIKRR